MTLRAGWPEALSRRLTKRKLRISVNRATGNLDHRLMAGTADRRRLSGCAREGANMFYFAAILRTARL